ncbi:MAG: hypothetical protein QOF60_3143 [Actinomycetota bacterium]|nr:hypothetical protein [Actinomycetota bacterium]
MLRRLAVALAVALAVGGFVYYSANSPGAKHRSLVERMEASPSGCHYDEVVAADPPVGEPIAADEARPNFYKPGSRAPADGQLGRAMSRGFVVLWYLPSLAAEDVAKLTQLSDDFGRALILVPRAGLDGKVAVTAWHRRLRCAGIDQAALRLFVHSFTDHGPEKGFV